MPLYYFHLKSPSRPVRECRTAGARGRPLARQALAYRLREHAAETGEDW
jgi:hypothetical protein